MMFTSRRFILFNSDRSISLYFISFDSCRSCIGESLPLQCHTSLSPKIIIFELMKASRPTLSDFLRFRRVSSNGKLNTQFPRGTTNTQCPSALDGHSLREMHYVLYGTIASWNVRCLVEPFISQYHLAMSRWVLCLGRDATHEGV
jgi:hypothetical protein